MNIGSDVNVTRINPYQFFDIVRIAEGFVRPVSMEATTKLLETTYDLLEHDQRVLAEAYNAMLAEARRSTRVEPGTKTEMKFEHSISETNFVALILQFTKSFQSVFREVRDVLRELRPASFLYLGTRKLPTTGQEMQEFSSILELNSGKVLDFVNQVSIAYALPRVVLDLVHVVERLLEGYYQTLTHRHSVQGMAVHIDPIRTDLALCLYENIDGHGEVSEGKKKGEVSSYSMRKATLLADTLTNDLFKGYLENPEALTNFLDATFTLLWDISVQMSQAAKEAALQVRSNLRLGALPRLPTYSEFKDALLTLEDLDPCNIVAKDKVGMLTSEEKVELDFKNETILVLASMLGESNSQELVNYVLERKEAWYTQQRDVNSFYVCRIGTGNAFGGEAPGMLEVVPGIKPKVNLDDILGAGFAEARAMIDHAKNSSKWSDLFLATSPSKKTDKMNVLLVGPMGCHRKGQKILMFDGTLMPVEMIRVGDLLMGPDSNPRKVLELRRGIDEMVEITPTKGEPWVVNKEHILTLVRQGRKKHSGEIRDVPVAEYMTWSAYMKREFQLFRVGVDFAPGDELPLDPYFLGALLGDGSIRNTPALTTIDEELVQEVCAQASGFNLHVNPSPHPTSPVTRYWMSGTSTVKNANPIMTILRELGLGGKTDATKFIPQKYKTASREERLSLLAGLIDTDGSLGSGCFDFQSKSEALAQDVAYVARSLGFAAYLRTFSRSIASKRGIGTYHRVKISGDTNKVPTRLKHKRAAERRQIKSVLRTGFKTKELPAGAYYGFLLDGDHRYLLGDFTVTHNCGKTEILRALGSDDKSIGIFAQASDFLTCWKGEAERNPKRLFEAGLKLQKETNRQVFFMIDEIDTILNGDRGQAAFGGSNLATEFQILMDGITSYPNLAVWGATNHPERIPMPLLRRFAKVLIVGELTLQDRSQLLQRFLSSLPLSKDFTDETWTDTAKMLDGAVGDTVRKVTDHIWREKMFTFVSKNPEKAEEVLKFIQDGGTKFDSSKATPAWRTKFHDILRPYVKVTPGDLLHAAQTYLDNPAIRQEIKTAVETYKVSKEHLVGMVSPSI
jgi:hypothetical protein